MAKKFGWKQKKTIGMLINRKQWQRDFDPNESTAQEIELEQGGYYVITENSNNVTPNYITTENP